MKNAPMLMKVAFAIYVVIGAVDIILAVMYFTSKEFISYHSQAIDAPWQDVEFGAQVVILALMKIAGAGWFVLGFFTIILALAVFRTGSAVAR